MLKRFSVGIETLLLFCITTQSDYEQVIECGLQSLRYGLPNPSEKTLARVRQLYGEPSSGRDAVVRKSLSAPISDRRPPDTNAAVARAQKNRPLNESPSVRSRRISQLNSKYTNSDQPELTEQLADLIQGKDAGRSKPKIFAELPKFYQSYPHRLNSCYITAPLEGLYTGYLRSRKFWNDHISKLPEGSGLKIIYESFQMRELASGTSAQIQRDIAKVGHI